MTTKLFDWIENIKLNFIQPHVVYSIVVLLYDVEKLNNVFELDNLETTSIFLVYNFLVYKLKKIKTNLLFTEEKLKVNEDIYNKLQNLFKIKLEYDKDIFETTILLHSFSEYTINNNIFNYSADFIVFQYLVPFFDILNIYFNKKINQTEVKKKFSKILYKEIYDEIKNEKIITQLINILVKLEEPINISLKGFTEKDQIFINNLNIYNLDDIFYNILKKGSGKKLLNLKTFSEYILNEEIYNNFTMVHKELLNSLLTILFKNIDIKNFKTTTFFTEQKTFVQNIQLNYKYESIIYNNIKENSNKRKKIKDLS